MKRGLGRGQGRSRTSAGIPRFIRRFCAVLSIVIGGALVLGGAGAAVAFYCNAPPGSLPEFIPHSDSLRLEEDGTVYLEVRSGESAIAVGRRLELAGLIKTQLFWNLIFRLDPEYIKSGTYRLNYPASQLEIRAALVSGQQILHRITIPEGLTLSKIAALFESAGICGAEEFLEAARDKQLLEEFRIPGATMEGYLYPDTYLFPAPYPAAQAVRALADTFFKRLEGIEGAALISSPDELHRRVTLASIIEREYRVSDEAPLMAGVFYNRLDIGMRLQSCATVEYVITEIQGRPHPKALYDRDTAIEDPYNTYLILGLPPGPISCPGAVALDAALHPQTSDYLYFRLMDPQAGRHYFSKTFDEHIRAASLYVKGSAGS